MKNTLRNILSKIIVVAKNFLNNLSQKKKKKKILKKVEPKMITSRGSNLVMV